MATQRIDVFFYGLFMDRELLRDKGVEPANVRSAFVRGVALRIGSRATLVRDRMGSVHGVIMSLTHSELDRLYSEETVRDYRPEAVLAIAPEGEAIPALCFNLPDPPVPAESNREYAEKLRRVAIEVGLPQGYIDSIR